MTFGDTSAAPGLRQTSEAREADRRGSAAADDILGELDLVRDVSALTRRVSAFDRPETSVTYSALVGTVLLSILVPFSWATPSRAGQWVGLVALGILGRHASISVLAVGSARDLEVRDGAPRRSPSDGSRKTLANVLREAGARSVEMRFGT